MHSRVERVVRIAERVARALALVLIALSVWRVLTWQGARADAVRIDGPLREALPGLAIGRAPAIHIPMRELPNVVERDWLVALRRAGMAVTWSDQGLPPAAAVSVTQPADPAGGIAIALATSGTGRAVITDTLGIVDSVSLGGLGARITAPSVQGRVTVRRDSTTVGRVDAPPARQLRPLLVTGSAGWETKFVIAALEERGWIVHARVRVSPTALVTQGTPIRIDTANYAAVVVLDSASAAQTAALIAYVRAGGGLVLAGDAGRVPGLAAIAPARLSSAIPGSLLRSTSAAGRGGLPMYPLVSLRADAIPIDQRDGHVVAAARREGAGRVILVGEMESWRWRMTGGPDAPAEHRAWWSGIVSSAAYAPLISLPAVDPEGAPFTALIDALGAPVAGTSLPAHAPSAALPAWIGVAILTLLLFEWASRRLRGER